MFGIKRTSNSKVSILLFLLLMCGTIIVAFFMFFTKTADLSKSEFGRKNFSYFNQNVHSTGVRDSVSLYFKIAFHFVLSENPDYLSKISEGEYSAKTFLNTIDERGFDRFKEFHSKMLEGMSEKVKKTILAQPIDAVILKVFKRNNGYVVETVESEFIKQMIINNKEDVELFKQMVLLKK